VPSLIKERGPCESDELIGPGTAKTSFPWSAARRAVMRDPESSAASVTKTA
jgi:hypothetical protein